MGNIFEKFNLNGRVAIVTGGAGLLGSEFCRTLAEAGAAVVVADLAAGPAGTVAKSLLRAFSFLLDITDPASCTALVEMTLKEFGRLDILVNSAVLDPKVSSDGTVRDASSFENYSLEAWKAALEVNLTGMFLATQEAVKPMKAQGKG